MKKLYSVTGSFRNTRGATIVWMHLMTETDKGYAIEYGTIYMAEDLGMDIAALVRSPKFEITAVEMGPA